MMNLQCCTQSQLIHKPLWNCLSWIGMRRCSQLLQKYNPSAYGDTISYFETTEPMIALTIDDGLSRGGLETSMANDVFDLLNKYNARATFFVCTDYVQGQEETVRRLFENGHELGNHLKADQNWYYPKLEAHEFQAHLQNANRILDDLEERFGGSKESTTRWFRAAQGIMNSKMKQVVADQEDMIHVLGDCYCDDWIFAEDVDRYFQEEGTTPAQREKMKQWRKAKMEQVARIMLNQAQNGGIAIMHMPEKGFREAGLLSLEYFLQGIQERGWSCVNLSELRARCNPIDTDDEARRGEID